MARPFATISGPLPGIPPLSVELATEINAGWTATVTYSGHHSVTFADLATSTITLNDGREDVPSPRSVSSPPMIARIRRQEWALSGPQTVYELIDESSYKLATGTLSFPTFEDGTASSIVSAVAAACGVTISGAPAFPIWREDVKQGDGWSILRRIAAVDGKQLLVQGGTGTVEFVAGDLIGVLPHHFLPDRVAREYHPADRYGKIFVSKSMGAGLPEPAQYYSYALEDETVGEDGMVDQAMDAPLSFVTIPRHTKAVGGFDWLILWDESDNPITAYFFGGDVPTMPAFTGSWPAVKFTGKISPARIDDTTLSIDVTIGLFGKVPDEIPSGIDPAFSATYGSGRGWPQPYSEALIPSEAFAASRWSDWLAEINRGTHVINASGPLECRIRLLSSFSVPGASGRVERVRYSLAGNTAVTDITVEVP